LTTLSPTLSPAASAEPVYVPRVHLLGERHSLAQEESIALLELNAERFPLMAMADERLAEA
jgi:hypothetical protein